MKSKGNLKFKFGGGNIKSIYFLISISEGRIGEHKAGCVIKSFRE